ncbi:MAG: hypothetical protein QME96_16065, partial [Myxococcota bacterium]|nr:hypothetical protein [Myxococcota bacterium]
MRTVTTRPIAERAARIDGAETSAAQAANGERGCAVAVPVVIARTSAAAVATAREACRARACRASLGDRS